MENKNDKIEELIQEAKKTLEEHYSKAHKVCSVMSTKDGKIYKGISLQGQKLHLCAEWSVITNALLEKVDPDTIVAVYKNKDGEFEIFPPCGLCRELFVTYFPELNVVMEDNSVMKAKELLPQPWFRRK